MLKSLQVMPINLTAKLVIHEDVSCRVYCEHPNRQCRFVYINDSDSSAYYPTVEHALRFWKEIY